MQAELNKEMLDAASAKAELKKPLKEIYQVWPNLLRISLNLVDYMGQTVPSASGQPLLEVCLTNAVNEFRSVSAQEYGTAAQMVAFIRGLLIDAPQLIQVSVGNGAPDPVLWEPFAQKLSAFEEMYSGLVTIYQHPYSDVKVNSMRLMILARIITVQDLAWIDQYSSLPTLLEKAA